MNDQEKLKVAREALESIPALDNAPECSSRQHDWFACCGELIDRPHAKDCWFMGLHKALSSLSSSEPEKCPKCPKCDDEGWIGSDLDGDPCDCEAGAKLAEEPEPSQGEERCLSCDDPKYRGALGHFPHQKPSPQVDLCENCEGTIESCKRSRIACCPECTHGKCPSPEPIGVCPGCGHAKHIDWSKRCSVSMGPRFCNCMEGVTFTRTKPIGEDKEGRE